MGNTMRFMAIEDGADDTYFIRKFINELVPDNEMEIFTSGAPALSRLRLESATAATEQELNDPDLIFLDLNMSGMNEFEFLENVRSDETLQHIPIVVMSTDGSSDTIHRAYASGANAMFQKPDSVEGYRKMMNSIVGYWRQAAAVRN